MKNSSGPMTMWKFQVEAMKRIPWYVWVVEIVLITVGLCLIFTI